MTRKPLDPDITRRDHAPNWAAAKVWVRFSFGVVAAIAVGLKECELQRKAPQPPPAQIINIYNNFAAAATTKPIAGAN